MDNGQAVNIEDLKCKKCPLNTKKKFQKIIKKSQSHWIKSKVADSPKALIVLESLPDDIQIDALTSRLEKNGITNYDIYSAIRCKISSFENVNIQDTFNNCGLSFDIKKYNVVITLGRGMFSTLENTEDFQSWKDFCEYNFNQTYFYTPIYWNYTIKVYPLPHIEYIDHQLGKSFEGFFIDHQLNKARNSLYQPTLRLRPVKTVVIDKPNEWLLDKIENDPPNTLISFDSETNSLNQYIIKFKVSILIISYDGNTSYILRFKDIDKTILEKYLDRHLLIGANIKYDNKCLIRLDINQDVLHIADEIITLQHMLNTQLSTIGLKTQSWFIGFGGYDKEIEDYKKKYEKLLLTDGKLDYTKIPENVMFRYAGFDGALTWRNRERLLNNPQKSIIQAYYEFVIPGIPAFMDMEIAGMPFDVESAKVIIDKLESEMKVLDAEIKEYFIEEFKKKGFNTNLLKDYETSSDQKLVAVIKKLKWKEYDTTDSGELSTGEDNLIYWKKDGHTIADKILKYREKASLCNTHLKGWVEAVSEYDGVAHPNFNQARADTLRTTHTKPNAGNIPAQGDSSKIIRPFFFKDYIVYEYDYSGFQLRIMAMFSNDSTMLDIFKNNGDPHSETASFIFHKNMDINKFMEFIKEEMEPYTKNRTKAKPINFSTIFSSTFGVLIGPIRKEWEESDILAYFNDNKDSLLEQEWVYESRYEQGNWIKTDKVNYVSTVAKIIWTKFFQKYSSIFKYIKSQHEKGYRQGYVDGFFGTRRHLPEMSHTNVNKKQGGKSNRKYLTGLENMSVNSDAQTFEALSFYKAMAGIRKDIIKNNLRGILVPRLMTHDSSTGTLPGDREDLIPLANEIYQRNMPIIGKYEIDFPVEGKFFRVWKDKKTLITKF